MDFFIVLEIIQLFDFDEFRGFRKINSEFLCALDRLLDPHLIEKFMLSFLIYKT